MAIQDTFIGNLRAARNIASGMVSPTPASTKATVDKSSPSYKPDAVDKPQVNYGEIKSKWRDAIDGHRRDTTWNSPAKNDASEQPLGFSEVQAIKPYKTLFDQAIAEYSSEPNIDRRMKILDDYGNNTALGTLPGVGWYLRTLRNADEAAKRSGNARYDYAGSADYVKRVVEAEINKFNPGA